MWFSPATTLPRPAAKVIELVLAVQDEHAAKAGPLPGEDVGPDVFADHRDLRPAKAPAGSDGRAFRSLSPVPNGRYRVEVLVNGVVRARGTIVKAC